jgi:hypothetical protein
VGSSTSGNGGGATLKAGTGGAGTAGGNGGLAQIVGGTAGNGSASSGNGGAVNVTGGNSGSVAGSAGGAVVIAAANGTSTGTGGAGGTVTISTGVAGGTGNNNGGSMTFTVGASTVGNGGSAINMTAGTGGVGSSTTGSNGGNLVYTAGAGGVGSSTGGTGGAVQLNAGVGGNSGTPGGGGIIQMFTASTTSVSERLRITNAGNVGIGTGTPQALLEIRGGHFGSSSGTAPTAAPATGAGTSATCTLSHSSDTAGLWALTTTATSPAAGDQCDITFQTAYNTAPICTITANNANAANFAVTSGVYITTSTTKLTVNFATADAVGHAYSWAYQCIQTE